MKAPTTRKAQKEDLPSILDILNEEILHGTSVYDYKPKTLAEISNWYEEKLAIGFPLLVAVINDKVQGYATYGFFRPREGYRFTIEHSVYLKKSAQGNGVGRVLGEELIPLAKDHGMRNMIGVVDASNQGSCTFHEKMGFKEAGRLKNAGFKFDRWLDVVFYQLDLTDG